MNRAIKGFVTAALLATTVSAGAATVLRNGSFEQGNNPPTAGFRTLAPGNTDISFWNVGSSSFGIDWVGDYWQAADGIRSVDLSGPNTGAIWQDINTTVGAQYTVSFFMAGNPDGGQGTRALTVSVGRGGNMGGSGEQPQYEVFTVTGNTTRANMGWEQRFYSFTAFDAVTRLTFASNERNPFGPALDNVSLLDGGGNPLPVPEPASWALMMVGFGMVGATIRRRRTTAVAA